MAGLWDWVRARFGKHDVDPAAQQKIDDERRTRETIATLPFERIETTSSEALATWTRLRDAGRGWPIVVGGDTDLVTLAEAIAIDDETPQAILAAAGAVEMPQALQNRFDAEYGEDPVEAEVGPWPGTRPQPTGLTVAVDYKGKPLDRVHILLIPTQDWTEVPAYLRWGNWNACPGPEEHVAAWRYWQGRYGLELVGMGFNVLNLRVARPPTTREAALALAREQFLYCDDIVFQGTETLSALAASLLDGEWWYFWWD